MVADATFLLNVTVMVVLLLMSPLAGTTLDTFGAGPASSSSSSSPQPTIHTNIEAAVSKAKIRNNLFITISPSF
jgi:hypothetical protein